MSGEPEIPELPCPDLPEERWVERLLTRAGTALDAAMLRGMQMVVDAMLMPGPEALPLLRDSAEAVLGTELQKDPRRFFEFEGGDPTPQSERSRFRRSLDRGVVLAREFATRYRPHGAEEREAKGAPGSGDRILVEHWMHEGGHPAGTIVCLHGFTMGHPRIDAIALFARKWFQNGLDVALVTLPHHGARKPSHARFSGEHFAVPHVARLSEAVRQAIYEIRLVTTWLRETTGAPVGMLGLSLGGYLSSLMAGLYDDLDFVIPMGPPVCIGDLAWRFLARSRYYARGLPPGFSQTELRTLFRIHSPLAHPLRLPRERLLIIAGRGDRIVPPEHPYALWCHWGEPEIHWFSGSHLAPFRRQRIVGAIVEHLERLDIL